jgi:hypothetical protein
MGCKNNQYSLVYPPNKPYNVLWTYVVNSEPMILVLYEWDSQWNIKHYEVCSGKGFSQYIANLIDSCIKYKRDDNYRIAVHYLSDLLESHSDLHNLHNYPDIETFKLTDKRYCPKECKNLQVWLNKSFWGCVDIKYSLKIARSHNQCSRPYAIVDIVSTDHTEFYFSNEPMISVHKICPLSIDQETGLGFPCFIQFWPKDCLGTLIQQEASAQIIDLKSNKFRRQILAESRETLWKFITMLQQDKDQQNGHIFYIPFREISKFNNTTAQLLFGGEQFSRVHGYIFPDYYRNFADVNRGKRLNRHQRDEMNTLLQQNPHHCIRPVFAVLSRLIVITSANTINIVNSDLHGLLGQFPNGSFLPLS